MRTEFYDESLLFRYLSSLYHAVNLLTGNDIGPRNEIQLSFVIILLTMGAIINANIIGELAVILAKLNRKATIFQAKLDTSNDAMKSLGLPEKLQVEITGFLTYSKSLLESQEELESFLSMISPSARQKVLKHMFTTALITNPIFKGSTEMIEFVAARLDTKILLPEFTIITQGEAGDNLYTIAKGTCIVIVTDHRGSSSVVNKLGMGDIFGEVALITGNNRTATVKTSSYSSIALLKRYDYDTVCRVYSGFRIHLRYQMKGYCDPLKEFIKKLLKNVYYFEQISNDSLEELGNYMKQGYFD